MSRPASFIIEFDEEAVGLVVTEDDRLTFHAVDPRTFDLHGETFADATEARRAVAGVLGAAMRPSRVPVGLSAR